MKAMGLIAGAVVLGVLALGAGRAEPALAEPARTSLPQATTGERSLRDCQEVNLFFTVPAANVRQLVPEKYALSGEANGEATIFLRAFRCEEFVWDVSHGPVEGTTVMVQIDSPDGTGVINAYVIFIASDSRAYNRIVWQSVDPELRVAYVKRFAIEFSPISLLESSFRALAPKPTPSPFTAEGIVDSNRLVMAERFFLNFWHDSSAGTLKFAVTVEGLELAPAEVSVTTAATTELARMFGAHTATSDPVTSNHAFFRRGTAVRTVTKS